MAIGFPELDRAVAAFEEKQRDLDEFQKKLDAASVSVDSQKKVVTVTVDGHGEISDLKFNNTAYRSMAPAELTTMLLDTIRRARAKSLEQVQELMGDDLVPGLDIAELNSGHADLGGVLGKLAEPALERVRDANAALHDRPRHLNRMGEAEADDGWER